MTNDKETIFAALYGQVTGSVSGVVTFSRRVRVPHELTAQEMPAVFVEQIMVQNETSGPQLSKQRILAGVSIYVLDESDSGPMTTVNGLVSQVEAALRRQPGEVAGARCTTLGGLVESARVTRIAYEGGNIGSLGSATIEVEILTTS